MDDAVVQVAARHDTTCVRTRQGRVACFGAFVRASDLSVGLDQATPAVVEVPASAEVTVGLGFSCSRSRGDGRVWCWGYNDQRRLGRKTATSWDYRPAPVAGVADAEQVAAGDEFACARRGRNALCWGGPFEEKSTVEIPLAGPRLSLDPVWCERGAQVDLEGDRCVVLGGARFEVSSGIDDDLWQQRASGRCVTSDDGLAVHCEGETIHGASASRSIGGNHVCWIDDVGGVRCQGDAERGQLGAAPGEVVRLPSPATSIATGRAHSCAVTRDAKVWCWGDATRGQLGLPRARVEAPRLVDAERMVRAVHISGPTTCIESDQGVLCTARRCRARLDPVAYGATTIHWLEEDTPWGTCVGTDAGAWCLDAQHHWRAEQELSWATGPVALWRHVLCSAVAGEIHCLGHWTPRDRELLRLRAQHPLFGEPIPEPEPVVAFGGQRGLVDVATFGEALCGQYRDGQVECRSWDALDGPPVVRKAGPYARLSQRGTSASDAPGFFLRAEDRVDDPIVEAGDIVEYGVRTIAGAASQYVARTASGSVVVGALQGKHVSRPETLELRATALAVGHRHACIIDADRHLWCWGDNDDGQLGFGTPCIERPHDITESLSGLLAPARAEDRR